MEPTLTVVRVIVETRLPVEGDLPSVISPNPPVRFPPNPPLASSGLLQLENDFPQQIKGRKWPDWFRDDAADKPPFG